MCVYIYIYTYVYDLEERRRRTKNTQRYSTAMVERLTAWREKEMKTIDY